MAPQLTVTTTGERLEELLKGFFECEVKSEIIKLDKMIQKIIKDVELMQNWKKGDEAIATASNSKVATNFS